MVTATVAFVCKGVMEKSILPQRPEAKKAHVPEAKHYKPIGHRASGFTSGRCAAIFLMAQGMLISGLRRRRSQRRSRLRLTAMTASQPITAGLKVRQLMSEQESARTQRLKDMVYVKDLRAAVTSGEFALQLRGAEQPGLIDYQSLCNRLDDFVEKLERQAVDITVLPRDEAAELLSVLKSTRTRLEERVAMIATPKGDTESSGASGATGAGGAGGPVSGLLSLYLREDRTVDFQEGLSEAARFSRDLWDRLNGRGHEESKEPSAANSQSSEPLRIVEKRKLLKEAEVMLQEATLERDGLLLKAKRLEAASLSDSRALLRICEQTLRERQCRQLLANMDLLLERAAVALEADLDGAGISEWDVSGLQLKGLVVEFSMLDRQASSYAQLVAEDPEACQPLQVCADLFRLLDPEELKVLEGNAEDLLLQIGLQAEGQEEQGVQLQSLVSKIQKIIEKAKTGISFYTAGVQLLWQDVQYASSLVSKAAFMNYNLEPWEVSTLFRTVKDCATLIPFLIILIIPMTPVGHVLVFSFIQKFYPDFFPSTFTERRQNVLKIYKEIVPDAR